MTQNLNPQKNDDSTAKDHSDTVREPDLIIVDNEEIWEPPLSNASNPHQLNNFHVPFTVRLFCLFFGLLAWFCAIGALILFLVSISIAALTLYKINRLNTLAQTFWKQFKRSFIFAIGLIIAFFSPTIGLGVVLMYFFMQDKSLDQGMFAQFLHRNFNHTNKQ